MYFSYEFVSFAMSNFYSNDKQHTQYCNWFLMVYYCDHHITGLFAHDFLKKWFDETGNEGSAFQCTSKRLWMVRRRSVTYLDVKLEVFVHLVDVGEDVWDDAGNDALHVGVAQHALHSVRLARWRLSVREDRAIVAAEHVCNTKTYIQRTRSC